MSHQITLTPSGRTFTCEQGETILTAALRHGINLNYGCRSGSCGTCAGQILKGEVYYETETLPALPDAQRIAGGALYCSAIPRAALHIASTEIDVKQTRPPRRMPGKIVALDRLSHDVMRVCIKLPEAVRVQFLAGQYLDIFQHGTERRSFSIANAPHTDESIELHIRHVDGGEFTDYIFNQMRVNEIVRVEIPLGTFFLREASTRPIILMGGGTGFAPLKGILEHALYTRIQRPMHLFWGVRARRDLYLSALPTLWQKQNPLIKYTPVLSDPEPQDHWQGATGWVHEAVLKHYSNLSGFEAYISGPPIMIKTAHDSFLKAGLPEDRLYSDAFEYNAHPGA